jgi:hypothetical protein
MLHIPLIFFRVVHGRLQSCRGQIGLYDVVGGSAFIHLLIDLQTIVLRYAHNFTPLMNPSFRRAPGIFFLQQLRLRCMNALTLNSSNYYSGLQARQQNIITIDALTHLITLFRDEYELRQKHNGGEKHGYITLMSL